MKFLEDLFQDQNWKSDKIFIKCLTTNDDSGRHGVLIPSGAYEFFPDLNIEDTSINKKISFQTYWRSNGTWKEKLSKYIYYYRYPERRITSLNPKLLNDISLKKILIAAKDINNNYRFLVFFQKDKKIWDELIKLVNGTINFNEGEYRVISFKKIQDNFYNIKNELIEKLKKLSEEGWIKTLRSGDTGIGYTLESKLGIKANSNQRPDYKGIEIKSARLSSKKITLFSKTPEYSPYDRKSALDKFGYIDDKGRTALKITICGNKENNQKWILESNQEDQKLYANKNNNKVFSWKNEILREKIEAKHNRTMFVFAENEGKLKDEKFHFKKIVYGRDVSMELFHKLIKEGQLCHDLSMHLKENGTVRDHGFLFRIEVILFDKVMR